MKLGFQFDQKKLRQFVDDFKNTKYSAGDAATAKAHLVDVETGHSWVITDGGQEV